MSVHDRLEFTPKNVEGLWMDYERMRKRGKDFITAISWIAPQDQNLFGRLAESPDTYATTRQVFDILKAHREWTFSEWGILRPSLKDIKTHPESKDLIGHIHRELFARAHLIDSIHKSLGSDRFNVFLGNSPVPLECRIDPEVKPGGTRFSLLEGKVYQYRGKARFIEVGMADVSINSPFTLAVGLIQDHNDDQRDWVKDPQTGERKRAESIASNRQAKVRKFMRRGRNVLMHPTASETAGVEELALYTAMEIMTQAGVLINEPSTQVTIPYPERTNWGGPEWRAQSGRIYASTGHTADAAGEALHVYSLYLKDFGKFVNSEELYRYARRVQTGWKGIRSQALFYYVQEKLDSGDIPLFDIDGTKTSLDRIFIDCIMAEIPEQLGPDDEWLKAVGYFDKYSNFREAGFENPSELFRFVANALTAATPQYLATFSPYYVAFYDAGGENTFQTERRNIFASRIRELPFASQVRIKPIVQT